jgi:GTP-binding protein HflX
LADPKREELQVRQKKAVLVAVVDPSMTADKDRVLDELRGLVKTAGVKAVDTLVQFRKRPHPATCLGKGKLEELKESVIKHEAELIVFDNNLTPAQGKRLEAETEAIIVDRSEVILDIFATTARTYEAKLQVELAQLLYFRPRLKRMWTHLERIEGGIGTGRGPGEKQLETDRRLIDRRVAELKKNLKNVEKRRRQTVEHRSGHMTVSLVGYTNAGKSTLMNALTGADVTVADKLFATLDTKTRRWHLSHWGDVLLSDTVGFVRNLPHHLVASFRSTLEEARHADLLLHVVDASHPEAEQQIQTVYQVLDEIGVNCDNMLLVLNKIDNCSDRVALDVLRRRYENSISLSAAKGTGLDRLAPVVAERLADGYVEAEIETSVGNGRLFAYLAEHGKINGTEYHDDSRVVLNCRIPRMYLRGANGNDTTVSVRDSQVNHCNNNAVSVSQEDETGLSSR